MNKQTTVVCLLATRFLKIVVHLYREEELTLLPSHYIIVYSKYSDRNKKQFEVFVEIPFFGSREPKKVFFNVCL